MEEKNILSSIINYLKPKAHDAIDGITAQWKESQARASEMMPNEEMQELLQAMVIGSIGGGNKRALKDKAIHMAKMREKGWSGHQKMLDKLNEFKNTDAKVATRLGGKGKTRQDADKFFGTEGDFFKNKIRSLFDDVSDVEF